jgi:phosphoribosylglycinamide formyltransferase-1
MSEGRKVRTGVLISGRGSNLQALIDAAAADPAFPAEIALVISNRPGAGGLERAAQAGIATATIDHKDYQGREGFDGALHDALTEAGVELVCLAGFMRILTPGFVARWEGRMLNIHPSLLPKYKGVDTHARALAAGDTVHGCSVHYVTAELDDGPVIAQTEVPVLKGDTPETLADRVLEAEHRLYPQAWRTAAKNYLKGSSG